MKGGQNLATLQQRKKEEEGWVKPQPCCICGKVIGGAYGSHEDGWTCSGKCEREYNSRSKYPGHTEEDFLQRQGESHVNTQARRGSPRKENEPRYQRDPGSGLLQEVSEAHA
jgi:hypothetical protein